MSSFVLNAPRVLSTGDSTCISKKPHCPKELYSAVKRIFIHLNKHLEFFRNFEFFLHFVGRKILTVGKIQSFRKKSLFLCKFFTYFMSCFSDHLNYHIMTEMWDDHWNRTCNYMIIEMITETGHEISET